MRCVLFFCAVLMGAVRVPAQQPLPPAPKASIVDISPGNGAFNEPSIAVNPKHPNEVLAVYQVAPFAAHSSDSGKTFSAPQFLKPPDYRIAGDVSATFDSQGHAFLCYLAFDQLGTPQYWAHGAGRNGIFLRRSLDGGKTWEKDAIAIKGFPTGHEPGLQFEDQARIFADTGERSPYHDRLYAGWIEWQLTQSIILWSSSSDAGKTWSPAIRISTHGGLPRDDNGAVGGIVAAIGRDGAIYAAWHDGNWITLAVSHDGGHTFAPSHGVIETAPPYFGEVPGVSRVCGFPQIGIDPAGRTLYLAWSDYRNGDIDVFVARSKLEPRTTANKRPVRSTDEGRHWSAPVRVNDDVVHDGTDQFFQWMAVDPITGALYVQFYDRRGDEAENRKTRFTLARSTDGGRTFTNYAWATNEFDSKGAFLGDYTWLAAYNNRVYGAWTEARPDVAPQMPSEGASGEGPQVVTVIRVGTADFSGVR